MFQENPLMPEIQALKDWTKDNKLSCAQVAQMLKKDPTTVARWFRGKARPKDSKILQKINELISASAQPERIFAQQAIFPQGLIDLATQEISAKIKTLIFPLLAFCQFAQKGDLQKLATLLGEKEFEMFLLLTRAISSFKSLEIVKSENPNLF